MIKKQKYTTLLFIVTIVYLTVVTFLQDPIKENYSMMTSNLRGYILVFGLCILLCLNLANTTYLLNKRYLFLSFGPIIGCLLPYKAYSGDTISNLHEVCAYIAFFFSLANILINLFKYKIYNSKKADILITIYTLVFFITAYMYFKTAGVVGIEEYLLLTATIIINYVIFVSIIKEAT